ERFTSFRGIAFPEKDEGLLEFRVRAITWIGGHGDSAVELGARTIVIAHERGGVSKSPARGNKRGIALQSFGVMFERALIVASVAQDFSQGVLRVWTGGLNFGISLERSNGL